MNVVCFEKKSSIFSKIDLSKDNVVEASAGTGKTFTIEELVVELLLEQELPIRALLLVTYTEKATSELKERIRKRLQEMWEQLESPGNRVVDETKPLWKVDPRKKELLTAALLDFDSVAIYTIHGFCHRMLREFAFENRQLLEQQQRSNQLIFPDLFRRYLKKSFLSQPCGTFEPFDEFIKNNTESHPIESLEQELLHLLDKEGKIIPELAPFSEVLYKLVAPLMLLSSVDRELRTKIPAVSHPVLEAFEQMSLNGVSRNKILRNLKYLIEVLAHFKQHKQESKVLLELLTIELNAIFQPRCNKNRKKEELYGNPSDLPALMQQWLSAVEQIFKVFHEAQIPLEEDDKNTNRILRVWLLQTLLPQLREELEHYKTEEGLFDFDDMLTRVYKNLKTPSNAPSMLTLAIQKKYRYAIIDEFQDTDSIQWEIFKSIFLDSSEHQLVVIGDPKQAIYGFRGADVSTYIQARTEITKVQGIPLRLDYNFRSTPDLIEGLNQIFEHPSLFQEESIPFIRAKCGRENTLLEDDYRDRKAVHLFVLLPSFEIKRKWLEGQLNSAKTEFPRDLLTSLEPLIGTRFTGWELFSQTVDQLWGEHEDSLKSKLLNACLQTNVGIAKESFAAQIAVEINRLLQSKPRLSDTETKKSRELEIQDICILFRSRAEGEILVSHLRKQNIPYAFYKQKGLFQTREAFEIYDLFTAINQPQDHSKRFKSWLTRFFSVPLSQVELAQDTSLASHYYQQLKHWHQLAIEKQFKQLFEEILQQTELLQRELFLTSSEREITNYVHLFEILTQQATEKQLDLTELLGLLLSFIQEKADPGQDQNLLRLESDRQAVQLMTMHASKGLEFPVVFIYGGFSDTPQDSFYRYHNEQGAWIIDLLKEGKAQFTKEQNEEKQRLLYVSLTRAGARLYLPYIPVNPYNETKELKRVIRINQESTYFQLLESLDSTWNKISHSANENQKEFSYSEVLPSSFEAQSSARPDHGGNPVDSFELPPLPQFSSCLGNDAEDSLTDLRIQKRGFVVSSFSRLHRKAELAAISETAHLSEEDLVAPKEMDELENLMESPELDVLPGGTQTGSFLHEVLESVDFHSLETSVSPEGWLSLKPVQKLFTDLMGKYNRPIEALGRSASIIWHTLTRPISLGETTISLSQQARKTRREMSFYFPIPEKAHPLLNQLTSDLSPHWEIQRGFLQGSIDFIFEYQGKVYFIDWKSNMLADYEDSTISQEAKEHYELQYIIYTLAILRWLQIRTEKDFDCRFGGALYIFLRGMPTGKGVFLHQPTWLEVQEYEQRLLNSNY
ncbi:UvrD-helicase domain-containing protein [Deltaproteobacteria bacterium TL4]